jgi:hypothetical protein
MPINWQDVLTNLGVVTGGGTVLVGASAWLIKTVITQKLATDAEAFKIRIQADANTEIERLRSSLQIVATEHQVRFTKLHENRAEIIADLYKKLVDLHRSGESFVITRENNPDPAKEKEFSELREMMSEFQRFYEQHQIYLPSHVCTSFKNLLNEITGKVWAAEIFGRIEHPSEHILQTSADAFTKAYEAFDEKIPAARQALEGEFRKMLGVESE